MKMSVRAVACLIAALTLSTPALAKYVSAEVLNCRAGPNASETVITKLNRGQSVEVRETSGTWSRLSAPSCWVLTRYLSDSYVSSSVRSTSSSLYGSTRASSAKKPKASKRSSSFQSGCPCSGSKVCIGPRGGRYCITSGGNKRYGV